MKRLLLCALLLAKISSTLILAEAPSAKLPADPIEARYRPELDRLQKEYETKIRALRLRMIADYEIEIKSAMTAKKLDVANALKVKIDELKSATAPDFRIVGKWYTTQSNNVTQLMTLDKDYSYKYGNDTGRWKFSGGKHSLLHTWDWEVTMSDENTFEGVCTRGDVTVTIRGVRVD